MMLGNRLSEFLWVSVLVLSHLVGCLVMRVGGYALEVGRQKNVVPSADRPIIGADLSSFTYLCSHYAYVRITKQYFFQLYIYFWHT